MVCLGRPYHFKYFKGCFPEILLGPFLNTLTHMFQAPNRNRNEFQANNLSDNQEKVSESKLFDLIRNSTESRSIQFHYHVQRVSYREGSITGSINKINKSRQLDARLW